MSRKILETSFNKTTPKTINNVQTKTLVPKMPFFGIKGTICTIEEAPECYYKVLYGANGKIDPKKKPVPKKKGKNLCLVFDDYYKDLKKYLDLNNNKYLEVKNTHSKKYLSKKKLQICIAIATLISLISVPAILLTTYIGAILEAISLVILYKLYNTKEKMKLQAKNQNFIKQYDNYQRLLIQYIESKQKGLKNNNIQATAYTKIATKEEPVRENERSKILVLAKEEKREAA